MKTKKMNDKQNFHSEIVEELDTFLKEQENRYPEDEVLRIDLHCHDKNSDVPDEIMGRILDIPESWLETEALINILKKHGCDTFTITNHNNARSCFELLDKGYDVLVGAEFSCMVPDYKQGIHVLSYGFTPGQEEKLNKLRDNIYAFQEYACEQDIPTIWAHPLYFYKGKGMPPFEFFNKMALLFERFEVINSHKNTWQNMLIKNWTETLTQEKIDILSKQYQIPKNRYCRHPYRKSLSGGSDSHMGIFAGLTGTRLHVPDRAKRLLNTAKSVLALEAIKNGAMAPYGMRNYNKTLMTLTILDYFCQIPKRMNDPGLLRLILHKGTSKDKILAFAISNAFMELSNHKVTMKFLELFHNCFSGKVPNFSKRFFIPSAYREIFNAASHMAAIRRNGSEGYADALIEEVQFIHKKLNEIFFARLKDKLDKLTSKKEFSKYKIDDILDYFEFPLQFRQYAEINRNFTNKKNKLSAINLSEFLDGLSFPFLSSAVILSASYTSSKVLYNSRPLLNEFSERLNKLKPPKRMLWLTDTFNDSNGVAMVLKSMHDEIKKKNLPIDLLVCSDTVQPDDHLIVIPPAFKFTLPFYEQQPFRVPHALDVHNIFRDGEYDRLICSTEGPMGLLSLYLKSAYSVPAYFYVHTDWMMFGRKVLELDRHNLSRLRRLLRTFYRGFDALFVLNTDQQKWLTGRDMGFDPSRVFLTAHWVDEGFEPKKANKQKVFGIKNGNPVMLFAGRVSEEKGVMELPEIYNKIREDMPEVKLAIAGKGPAEKELKKKLPDAIYLGWIEHDKLPEIYSAADMFILPSRFDTFGCVVLEALSCGLPVIAYKTKGPKDIVKNGENGFLVNNRKEIIKASQHFLADSTLQKTFKKSALQRASMYNADRIVSDLINSVGLQEIPN